jgi:hypothetical protein
MSIFDSDMNENYQLVEFTEITKSLFDEKDWVISNYGYTIELRDNDKLWHSIYVWKDE